MISNLTVCDGDGVSSTFLAVMQPRSGSLFSASLSHWNRDPGCRWSRDHLSIQNRRVGGYSGTFGREDDKIPNLSSRFFYLPDSGWSRDQRQPGSLFQRLREAEKRDPGNEVASPQEKAMKHRHHRTRSFVC